MKIKTKIPVTYNDGLLGTKTDFVQGVITALSIRREFKMFIISYSYIDNENNEISNGNHTLSDTEINTLNELIKVDLPINFDTLTESEQTQVKYYKGFVQLMAETFNINKADIELID